MIKASEMYDSAENWLRWHIENGVPFKPGEMEAAMKKLSTPEVVVHCVENLTEAFDKKNKAEKVLEELKKGIQQSWETAVKEAAWFEEKYPENYDTYVGWNRWNARKITLNTLLDCIRDLEKE